MKVQFQATSVAVQEENEVVMVAFANDTVPPTEVFMLQYALFEEPDQPIYCERNDQSQGCYDGIKNAELYRTSFNVELNDEGKARLDCDRLEIGFEVDESEFFHLQTRLHQILSYSGVLVDMV